MQLFVQLGASEGTLDVPFDTLAELKREVACLTGCLAEDFDMRAICCEALETGSLLAEDKVRALSDGDRLATEATTRALARASLQERGQTPSLAGLFKAAESDDVAVCALHLDAGVAVDACDADGTTCLMIAAECGATGAANLLLARGANADTTDAQGWTALMYAVVSGMLATVRVLLSHGACPDAADRRGVTALFLAQRNGLSEIELMLHHGRRENG